jgi:chromosome segregation ATPase
MPKIEKVEIPASGEENPYVLQIDPPTKGGEAEAKPEIDQALRDKKKDSKAVPKKKKDKEIEEQLALAQSTELKEYAKQIEDLQARIKDYTSKIKQLEADSHYKDEEISHYKKIASELASKVEVADLRETEFDTQVNVQKVEIEQLKTEITRLSKVLEDKDG